MKKIQANRERDRRTTALLRRAGWRVMRVWEGDILTDASSIASRVIASYKALCRRKLPGQVDT
jgi:G:T-mismatch repair DNA endonuclease (very short patch repair protein)